MKTKYAYKILAGFYDLLDIVYFRDDNKNTRKSVLIKVDDNDRVLDLCTGTATCALSIAKSRPKTKVVGIDQSKDMIRVARNKLKRLGIRNVRLYQMDATSLKFKSECFDKILISLILQEMEYDLAGKIITEARRVLKDDGEIITEWEPSNRLTKKILFFPIHCLEPRPYREFIKKGLYSYFRQFGLKIEKYEHCDYTKVLVLKKSEAQE